MDPQTSKNFITLWRRYFASAELPLGFYYADEDAGAPLVKPGKARRCLVATLAKVRPGRPMRFGRYGWLQKLISSARPGASSQPGKASGCPKTRCR